MKKLFLALSCLIFTTLAWAQTQHLSETKQPLQSVLFIDPGVQDFQQLLGNAEDNTAIHILDPQKDGVQQIANFLTSYKNLASIQILSHGHYGQMTLGSTSLNHTNLSQYHSQLQTWGNALSENGDILIYGCNIAGTGIGDSFVDRLSLLTKADIAASTNETGAKKLGADWILEKETGIVEAHSSLDVQGRAAYNHILSTISNTGTAIGQSGGGAGNEMGQSFTATVTGTLTSIAIASDNGCACIGTVTLRIYDGEGRGGSELHSQSVTLTDTANSLSDYSLQTITLDSTVSITQNSVYTFSFLTGTSQDIFYTGNNYSGGQVYFGDSGNGAGDLSFEIVQSAGGSDPEVVSMSYNPTSITAENGGSSTLTVALSTTPSTTSVVSLSFGGNATSGVDYTASSNSISIGTADTSGSITITAIDDKIYEGASSETLTITISSITNATTVSGASTASLSIIDDNSNPSVSLYVAGTSATSLNISEASAATTIVAFLSNATTVDVAVGLSYTGNATSGSDYTTASTITVSAGATTGATTLTAISDSLYEASTGETVRVDITSVSGGDALENGSNQNVIIGITEDDSSPSVSLSSTSTNFAEAEGANTITVTLSNGTTSAVTVSLSYSGNATSNSDFSGATTSLTISAESTTNSFVLNATSDSVYEVATNETFAIDIDSVSGGGAAENGSQTLDLGITEDESAPTVSWLSTSSSMAENGGTSTPTVTMDVATTAAVTVQANISLTVGTGGEGVDYTTNGTTTTISAGSTTATFSLTGVDDDIYETLSVDEQISVVLFTVTGGGASKTSSNETHTVTITEDESRPVVSLSTDNSSFSENAGTSTITVTLDNLTTSSLTVNLSYSGNATSNTDFSAADSITISGGSYTGSATLTGTNDSTYEANESFTLEISSITSDAGVAESGGAQSLSLSVTDDDSAPTVSMSASPTSIAENSGASTVTVSLSSATTVDVTVGLSYSGTATSNTDYTFPGPSTSVTISNGTTSTTFSVASSNDSTSEGNETIIIDVDSVSGGDASEPTAQQSTITITDDDDPIATLSASSASLTENAGTSVVTVTLSTTPTSDAVIGLSFGGTATTGTDYSVSASTITIGTSATTGAITVTSIGDSLYESSTNETIIVGISSLSNATTSSDQSQTLSITEDESEPIVALSVGSSSISENTGATTLTATLTNNATTQAVVVSLSLSGTASSNASTADVTLTSGGTYTTSITISAESTTGTASITGLDDSTYETSETFIMSISSVTNATSNSSNATSQTVTLTDDESSPTVSLSATSTSFVEAATSKFESLDIATSVILTLSGATTSDVIVSLSFTGNASSSTYTTNGTTVTADYSANTGSHTISSGSTTSSFTITAIDDSLYEASTENISISIDSVSGGGAAKSGTQSLTLYLAEDESVPAVSLSASNTSFAEAAGSSVITVDIGTATTTDVTVALSYSGNATSNSDFSGATTSLTFSSGDTLSSFTIAATSDSIYEMATSETFAIDIISVSGGGAAESGTQTLNLGIIEDDSAPSVSLSASSVSFAEAAGTSVITVNIGTATTTTVSVSLSYSGNATSNSDFSGATTSLTFSSGDTTSSFTLTGTSDSIYEGAGSETFAIDISGVSGGGAAESGTQTLNLGITEDDSAPSVSLAVSSTAINENADTSVITVTLSNATSSNVVVTLDYNSSTATNGTDFTGATSLTISTGATTATTTLTATSDDSSEGNENIVINISGVSGGGASESGEQSQTVTVIDAPVTPVYAQYFVAQTGSNNPLNGVDVGAYSVPFFVDIDVDGDYDVFIGDQFGMISYYKNTGSASSPTLTEQTGSANPFNNVDVGTYSAIAFVDIDGDGDQDIFIGEDDGVVNYYKNTGTAQSPTFSEQTGASNPFNNVDVGSASKPAFVDIDNDGDQDAFIGESGGTFKYYQNTGTAESATFSEQTGSNNPFNGVNIGSDSAVAFIDFDGDGDQDAFIGERGATSNYYKNTGSAQSASFSEQTGSNNPFNDVGFQQGVFAPVDIDNDGDQDMFLGEFDGELNFYKNYTSVSLSVSNSSIAENAGTSTVTLTLSNTTTSDVTVTLSTGGTAVSGTDYGTPASSATISTGGTTTTFTVTSTDDAIYETGETITLDINTVSGGGAIEKDTQSSTITITDDESAPTVGLSASPTSMSESSGASTLTVSLSGATTVDVTIGLSYSGTATSNSDYTFSGASTNVTISNGTTSTTFSVASSNDSTSEGNETIIVDVDSVSGGGANESTAQQSTITITDDDAPIATLSVSSTSLVENAGTSVVTVSLSNTPLSTAQITLNFDGTATSGTDYSVSTNTISIDTNSTTGTVTITSIGDNLYEASTNETILVAIGSLSNATTTSAQSASLSITEDESEPVVTLSASPTTVSENGGTSTLTVALSNNATTQDVVVSLSYSGTATSNTDFSPVTSITISAESTTNTATLTSIVDSTYEGADETFTVDISSVTNATTNSSQAKTITIDDNESEPTVTLSVSSTSIAENAGTSLVTITLSNATTSNVSATLSYTGTATSGTDYSNPTTSFTINAGSTTTTATLTAITDSTYEGANETIIVDISSLTNATTSSSQSKTVSITEDENSPNVYLSLSASSLAENSGTTLTVSTTMDTATSSDVVVTLSYGGTATSGTDYSSPSTTLTISTASTSASTSITLSDDSFYEGNETIAIEITDVSGGGAAESASQSETFTITENESAPKVSLSGDSSMLEAAGTATVTVTLSTASSSDVVVSLGYSATGSGGSGTDFSTPASSVTISAQSTTNTITLTALTDSVYEGANEVITVSVTDVSGGGASEDGEATHTVSITEDDSAPKVYLSLSASSLAENSGSSFTVSTTMDTATSSDVTVTLSYNGGTATSGTDYSGAATTITISALSTSSSNTISLTDDSIYEGNETISISISDVSGGGASEQGSQAETFTITENESAPTVSLSGDSSMAEAGGSATLTVTLSTATSSNVTVTFSTAFTGGGGSGTDFNTPATSTTISAGSTTNTITLTAISDSIYEGSDEVISIAIDSVSGGGASKNNDQPKTVSITEDDSAPTVTLSASSNTILEAAGTSTLTVTMSGATSSNVTVTLSFGSSTTATSGSDFTVGTTSLTIIAGSTTSSTTLTSQDDSDSEGTETIVVEIDSVSGGGASESSPQSETISITDDDAPVVSLSISDTTLAESSSEAATITATLDRTFTSDVTVGLSYGGTATTRLDYSVSASTITISTGATTGTSVVTATKDLTYEGTSNETLTVDIGSLTNATTSTSQTKSITITEGDSAPTVTLSASGNVMAEASGASTLTVTLSVATTSDVVVNLSYSGTATSGSDYTAANSSTPATSVTIRAGGTTSTIGLVAIDDNTHESSTDETIIAEISSVSGGGASESSTPQSQTITITEASSSPSVFLSASANSIAEASGATTLTATLSSATTADVTVGLSFSGTASSADYGASATTITISIGSTTGTVVVTSASDSLYDPNETVIATIDSVSGGNASKGGSSQSQTISITEASSAPTVELSSSSTTVAESSGSVTLTATMSIATTADVTVNLSYSSSTATSGTDFSGASSVTISAGSTTGTATVSSISDSLYDPSETIVAEIGSVSGGGASEDGNQSQTITINEGSDAPTVSLSVNDTSISETSGATTLTATLTIATTTDVVVNFSYSNGTAISGTDFSGASSLTISAGSTTGIASLASLSDTIYDPNESIRVEISSVSGGGASENGDQSQSVSITDDESAPSLSLSASSNSISETDGASTLTVSLSVATTSDVVAYLSYSGTATSGTDYLGANSNTPATSLTISAGSTTNSTSLVALHDVIHENDETVIVEVINVLGGGAKENGNQSQTVMITDDESAPTVTLSRSVSSIAEASGSVILTVTMSHASTNSVTVDFSYSASTATHGVDFSGASSLTIAAGSTTNTMTVTAIQDPVHEGNEDIVVEISLVSGATESGSQSQTITITDDDTTPSVTMSAGSTSITESSSGVRRATGTHQSEVTIAMTHASTSSVTVDLSISGSGEHETDFTVAPTSLTILAGGTTGTFVISAIHDTIDEDDETAIIDIDRVTASGAESGEQQITVTIVDDDAPPTITMTATQASLAETGGTSTLNFTLSSISGKTVTIALSVSGTAASSDYLLETTSVTIPAGSTTASVLVSAVGDSTLENDETLVVDLVATNATESTEQQQTLTIADDDFPTVNLSIDSETIAEASGVATVTATLHQSYKNSVTVNLSASGTASSSDFTLSSQQMVISAGATTQSVTVTASQDQVDDDGETVIVEIASLENGVTGTASVTTTIIDDDTAGVTVGTISGDTSEDNGTATFTVVLQTEPTAEVTVNVNSSDSSEGTASPSALIFTAANWNVAQTVTVVGVDDALVDGIQTYSIGLTTTSTDAIYNNIDPDDVSVTNIDNDVAGFIVSEVQGTLKEDDANPTSASFTVRLKTQPVNTQNSAGDVTVSVQLRITAEDGVTTDTTEASFSKTEEVSTRTLTFTKTNWQADRTITLFSLNDEVADGDIKNKIIFENLSSEDENYTLANQTINLALLSREVTVIDNNQAGVIVGAVSGNTSEDGRSSAKVQVSLKTLPSSNVTINVTSGDEGEVVVTPSSLTFTPENWAALQTVQFSGVNDNVTDGPQIATITFQGAATNGDENYREGVTATTEVTNNDDDTAALVLGTVSGNTKEDGTSASFTVRLATQPDQDETVTVAVSSSDTTEGAADRAALVFTRENWDSDQTILVFGVDDDIRDGKIEYMIMLNTQSSTGTGGYQGLSSEVTLLNEDDEVVGIVLSEISDSVSEDGATATFTVRLQSQPSSDVVIDLNSSDTAEGTVSPSALTFTSANWRSLQTATVTGVDDTPAALDGDQSFIIQLVVNANQTNDPDYSSLAPGNVEVVNLDNDKAGVVRGLASGDVSENGNVASFSLRLLSAPQSGEQVVISVTSSNPQEGTVFPKQMIFTDTNWNAAQNIVVQGVEDSGEVDGPQQFFVEMAVDNEATTANNYDNLTIESVEFFNADNDTAGFVVSEMSGAIQEDGLIPQSFTVKLSSQPANSATVTVALRVSDSSEGRISPSSLTFTSETWSADNQVNVFGVDDSITDGNQSFYVHFDRAESDDSNYHLTPPSVSVVNEDNDVAHFVVSPLSNNTREDGIQATFTVRLGSAITGSDTVTLPLSVIKNSTQTVDALEAGLSKSELVFTADNWDADQTVLVTGLNDSLLDGDQIYFVVLGEVTSTDSNYNGLNPDDLQGVNEDDDAAGLVVTQESTTVSEEATRANFLVSLRTQPASSVTVSMTLTDSTEASLPNASAVFNSSNWDSKQTIKVVGVDDDIVDGNQTFFVELTAASADANYSDLPIERIGFVNEDNDVSGFIVTDLDSALQEDGSRASFKVKLRTQPASDVTLSYSLSDTTEAELLDGATSGTLTFTSDNWKADQRVVLKGKDDQVSDGDQSFLINFVATQANSGDYDGLFVNPLQGINKDNDIADFLFKEISNDVREDGTQANFSVRLRSQPSDTVTVVMESSNSNEATLSTGQLAFTPDNWNAWQKVVVTGVDDSDTVDGNQPYQVNFTVTSSDASYNGFVLAPLSGTNIDDDLNNVVGNEASFFIGGALISEVNQNVNEQGRRAFFTIRLVSQPSSNVVITMTNSDTSEGQIVTGDELVTFTPDNWSAEQQVRVEGIDDNFEDGDQQFFVQFASVASTDPLYNGIELSLDPVAVINEDDDIAGFILTPITRDVREDGTTATFEISLRSRPEDENQGGLEVSVNLTSSNPNEASVDPASITFTSDDWRARHRVLVQGRDDTVQDGDQEFSIDFSQAVSVDPKYNGKIPDSVTLLNLDDDVAEFIFTNVEGQTSEKGERASFTVRLRSAPTGNVVLDLAVNDDTEADVFPKELVFTQTDWSSPKTVVLIGKDDAIVDGNQSYILAIKPNAEATEDSNYASQNPDDLTLTNIDNDSAGFIISKISGNVTEEGLEEFFTVRLTTQPSENVIIPVSSSLTSEGIAKVSYLTFGPDNWNADQRVGVIGVDDEVQDGNQPFSILLGKVFFGDSANPRDPTDVNDPYKDLVAGEVEVINEDNDNVGIVIGVASGSSEPLEVSENQETNTFFVRLRSQPEADVSITLSSTNIGEVRFFDGATSTTETTLVFNPTNWRGRQTVTVIGVDDQEADGEQLVTIRLAAAQTTNSTDSYNGFIGDEVDVLNKDNDKAGILISAINGDTKEDGSVASFTVRLQSQPSENVTLTMTTSDSGEGVFEGNVTSKTLTFTSGDWDSLKTVRIAGVDDVVADGDQDYQIEFSAISQDDVSYAALDVNLLSPVAIVNKDDEQPGFIATQPANATREDGTQATFFVRLSSAPAAETTVSVDLQSSNTNEGQVFPATLFFNENNWNANQIVTIIGQDDVQTPEVGFFGRLFSWFFRAEGGSGVKDGDQAYQIQFGQAESTDPNYAGLIPDRVRMVNEDDDTAGYIISNVTGTISENQTQGQFSVELRTAPADNTSVTIGISSTNPAEGIVSPQQLVFTPEDWNATRTITITGIDDSLNPVADGDRPFDIELKVLSADDAEYASLENKSIAVINEDNDAAGVVVSSISGQAREDGQTATFTVSLQSQPTADVQVSVSSSDENEITVSPSTLSFTSETWQQAQTVTLTGNDDPRQDGNQTVRISFTTTASADNNYAALIVPSIETSNEDNDIPDFLVGDLSLERLSEADLTTASTLAVSLKTQPVGGDVTIAWTANKDEVTLNPTSFVFTAENWNTSQVVTISPEDDSLADRNQRVRIVGTTTSDDVSYNNRVATTVFVVNEDNDTPGVTVSAVTGTVEEDRTVGAASFTLVLNTEPTNDVTIAFTNATTATYEVDTTPEDSSTVTTSLVFTNANWNVPQSVKVFGKEDQIDTGSEVFQISAGVTSDDGDYNGLVFDPIQVTRNDNDSAGYSASLGGVALTLLDIQEGQNATFEIKLSSQPANAVVLTLASTDTGEADFGDSRPATTVEFDSTNWNTSQSVTVYAIEDNLVDGDQPFNISVVGQSNDAGYNKAFASIVGISRNSGGAGVIVTPVSEALQVNESETTTTTFTVVLKTRPAADVLININSSDTTEALVSHGSENPSATTSLTFTESNWGVAQTVTITAVDDVEDDDNQSVSIQGSTTSDDSNYNGLNLAALTVMVVDNDVETKEGNEDGVPDNKGLKIVYQSDGLELQLDTDTLVVSNLNSSVSDVDEIHIHTPADGSDSEISQTTTILHKKTVGDKKAGLEGIVEPKLVNDKSTVYLEGNAKGFVSDAAAFMGTKTTDDALVQANINFDGGIEIAVTPTGSDAAILLPEMALGANAVISETAIVVDITLPDNVEGAPRTVGAVDATRWYYMGRDLDTNEVVYLRGKSGAKIKITRQLNRDTTLIRIEEGTAEVRIGEAAPVEKGAGDEFSVQNKAYQFTINPGSNLISAGVNSTLSAAELEVKMRTVHSIWRWNYVAPDWQVYSPQVEINKKLIEELKLSRFTTDIQPSEGLWIYHDSKEALSFLMHDKDYAPMTPDLSLGGWYLLGNNTGQPVNIGEFVEQNQEIQSLWLVRDDRWKAYATDQQIVDLIIEETDVDQLSADDVIPLGQAIWVNTETGITIHRDKLRLPPGGN